MQGNNSKGEVFFRADRERLGGGKEEVFPDTSSLQRAHRTQMVGVILTG